MLGSEYKAKSSESLDLEQYTKRGYFSGIIIAVGFDAPTVQFNRPES